VKFLAGVRALNARPEKKQSFLQRGPDNLIAPSLPASAPEDIMLRGHRPRVVFEPATSGPSGPAFNLP
jgi:hypothetical protein